jgi:hypothetical protein
MDPVCHRCGNSLHEGEGFCSHCGAPQLMVDASESAGPQQPPQRLGMDPTRVEWRTAILSAMVVGVPLGLLSALAGDVLVLLLLELTGGFATIALYRKRSEGFTDGRIGWRVGAILGTAAALIASATNSIQLTVQRYVLHHGAIIDGQFQTVAQQMAEQTLKSNSAAMQQAPQVMHAWANFWLSPDGHAAIELLTVAVMAFGIVLFAATGGAIAGRILAARPKAQRTL